MLLDHPPGKSAPAVKLMRGEGPKWDQNNLLVENVRTFSCRTGGTYGLIVIQSGIAQKGIHCLDPHIILKLYHFLSFFLRGWSIFFTLTFYDVTHYILKVGIFIDRLLNLPVDLLPGDYKFIRIQPESGPVRQEIAKI